MPLLCISITARSCWLSPVPTSHLGGIQWVSTSKQCLPLCRLIPNSDTYYYEVATWGCVSVSAQGDLQMSCIPLPKERAKPINLITLQTIHMAVSWFHPVQRVLLRRRGKINYIFLFVFMILCLALLNIFAMYVKGKNLFVFTAQFSRGNYVECQKKPFENA